MFAPCLKNQVVKYTSQETAARWLRGGSYSASKCGRGGSIDDDDDEDKDEHDGYYFHYLLIQIDPSTTEIILMTDHKEKPQGDEPKKLSLRQVLETIDNDVDVCCSSSDSDTIVPPHRKQPLPLDQFFSSLSVSDDEQDESVEIVVTSRRNHNPAFMLWNDPPQGTQESTPSVSTPPPPPPPPPPQQRTRLIAILEQQEDDYEIISHKPSILWSDDKSIRHPSQLFRRIGIDWQGTLKNQDIVVLCVIGLCGMVVMMAGATMVYRYWIRPHRHQQGSVRSKNGVKNNHGVPDIKASTVATTLETPLMDSNKNVDATSSTSPFNTKKRKLNNEVDKGDDPIRIHDAKRLEPASNPPSLCNEQNGCVTSSSVPDDQNKVMSPLPHQQAMQEAASQLAWDIQVVQQVFEQLSLDVALAPQVALNLRCSQQLLAAQAAHHQVLFNQQRQISQSGSFDFSWKDKLRMKRDECCNVAYRLLWEVALVHWGVVRVARPVFQLLQSGGDGTILTSAHCLQYVLHTLCDCSSTKGSTIDDSSCSTTTTITGTEGFWWVSFVSTTNDALWHYYWGWWNSASSGVFEVGACYGYCLVSTSIVLTMALVSHQLFRAFSAPLILHHTVNAVVLSILSGAGPTTLDNVTRFIPLHFIGLLLVGVAGILAVIQWNYQIQHSKMTVGSKHNFRKSWEECMDTMDSLQLRISMTRYAALLLVIGSGVFLLSMRNDNGLVDNTNGGAAVTSSVELS